MPLTPMRLRRTVAALALGVLAPALSAAATTPAQAATPTAAAPVATAVQAPALAGTSRILNLTMQAQQQTNWCWAASGNTIATFYGYGYSQNQFCNLAFGRSVNSTCPNSQATLGDVQNALYRIGISTGSYVNGYLRYSTVQTEIDAGRPVETRIQWSSGGGHMNVLYGYDVGNNWLYWGDPWPSDYRYNWGDYTYYVSNGSFSWTHSLYRIGA
ncbi:papain-like cysteine protease family protein [Streptomyces sp. TLI_171]|uniref:papain-like cysteine protease family protein n=1 Tax=Streptomyces sp. TLI_171 TaxID=1938859 RepID=UPI000C1A4670|nr:papain-like cysteine protease family protein [Streptomyces sp. TLI_171]RKE20898.1 papain like cysteine protease AvrRpt2 [Streptomyces sp. TLI_171]